MSTDPSDNNPSHGILILVMLGIICCGAPLLLPLLLAGLAATAPVSLHNGSGIAVGVVALILVAGLIARRRRSAPMIEPEDRASAPAGGEVAQSGPPLFEILTTTGCVSCAGAERAWEILHPSYGDRVRVEIVDLLDHPEAAVRYRVLQTPAVVINGELRAQGPLDRARLRRLLDQALGEMGQATIAEGERNA